MEDQCGTGKPGTHTHNLTDDRWQPIDTAPKDVPVLVAVPSASINGHWLVGEAYCRDDDDESAAGWWWANTGPNEYGVQSLAENGYHPTLWCPMPTPPLD